MILRPPISTRTDTRFPCTTRFRSVVDGQRRAEEAVGGGGRRDLHIADLVQARAVTRDAAAERAGQELGDEADAEIGTPAVRRSEAHTSELQSLMRISYAVF